METQHQYAHQYLKDILNILSQRISGDFMNTKGRQDNVLALLVLKWNVRMFIRMRTFQP